MLGRRLRGWREEAGLSPYQLARRAGLHFKTVQRLEQGEDAKVSTWLKALRALGRQPVELWAGIELAYVEPGEKPKELKLGETERRILEWLRERGGKFTGPVAQLARQIGRSERETWKGLKNLLGQGRIIKLACRKGRGQGNTYVLAGAETGARMDEERS